MLTMGVSKPFQSWLIEGYLIVSYSIQCRDAPLYLEWAPSSILSQSSTSKNNDMNGAIGENDAKRQILEQHVERITDVDIDPDRVDVWPVKSFSFDILFL